MNRSGLILQINHQTATILSEDHEYLRIRRREGFAVGQTIRFSSTDIISLSNLQSEGYFMKKKWITVAASLMLVAIVGVIGSVIGFNPSGTSKAPAGTEVGSVEIETAALLAAKPVAAIIAIDINPSIELSIDADGYVLEATAMNDDAATLDLKSLIGLTAEAAIDAVVSAATEAGFIENADALADYVVVTTVQLDAAVEPLFDRLQIHLQQRIDASTALQAVNLAMLQATEQQRIQAHTDRVPLGLQIMNQRAVAAGLQNATSVREFFSNQERTELAAQEGFIWRKSIGANGNRIQDGTSETLCETTGTGAGNGPMSGSGPIDGAGPGTGQGAGPGTGEPSGTGTGEPIGTGDGSGGINRGGAGTGLRD